MLSVLIVASVAVVGSAQLQQFPNMQLGEIKCSSLYNNQPNQCQAPGRIVEAWVKEQSSYGKCRVYSSFGFVANYFWVRNGCGGTFGIMYQVDPRYSTYYPNAVPTNYPNNCQTGEVNIFCFSTVPETQVCRVPTLVERVSFRQSLTGSSFDGRCQLNSGYGISRDQSAVWTNRGCQGVFDVQFRICPRTSAVGCRTLGTTLRCGNGGFAYEECRIPVDVTSVRLSPTASLMSNTCVENVSYLRESDGVRVSRGCRGSFALTYRVCGNQYSGYL